MATLSAALLDPVARPSLAGPPPTPMATTNNGGPAPAPAPAAAPGTGAPPTPMPAPKPTILSVIEKSMREERRDVVLIEDQKGLDKFCSLRPSEDFLYLKILYFYGEHCGGCHEATPKILAQIPSAASHRSDAPRMFYFALVPAGFASIVAARFGLSVSRIPSVRALGPENQYVDELAFGYWSRLLNGLQELYNRWLFNDRKPLVPAAAPSSAGGGCPAHTLATAKSGLSPPPAQPAPPAQPPPPRRRTTSAAAPIRMATVQSKFLNAGLQPIPELVADIRQKSPDKMYVVKVDAQCPFDSTLQALLARVQESGRFLFYVPISAPTLRVGSHTELKQNSTGMVDNQEDLPGLVEITKMPCRKSARLHIALEDMDKFLRKLIV